MPYSVHLIALPPDKSSIRQAISSTHRQYTRYTKSRDGLRNNRWHKMSSFPMEDAYLWQAARHIDLDPVRAGLVNAPEDWQWSSARARILSLDDLLVSPDCPLLLARKARDWRAFLAAEIPQAELAAFQRYERAGRPMGSPEFIDMISKIVDGSNSGGA